MCSSDLNAQATAAGGAALPGVPEAAARALLASRSNTLFSVPMLFFMAASSHLALPVSDSSHYGAYWACAAVVIGALEFNALKGKLGPIETVKGVITCGFLLALLFVLLMAVVL